MVQTSIKNHHSKIALLLFLLLFLLPGCATSPVPNPLTPLTPKEPSSAKLRVIVPHGLFIVEVERGNEWIEVRRLGFTHNYTDRAIDLADMIDGPKPAKVRLRRHGGGKAHIDAITLGDAPPSSGIGIGAEDINLLSYNDLDVAEAPEEGVVLTFPAKRNSSMLRLRARIETEIIPTTPFLYPPENQDRSVSSVIASTSFYKYKLGEKSGSFGLTGDMAEVEGDEPLAKILSIPGSGHPVGFTYIWIRDDGENLYAVVEFTSDNTRDGGVDYASVYATGFGKPRVFTITELETRWGAVSFGPSKRADYRHKYYEFKIPFAELNARPGNDLKLAFAAYGTASLDAPANGSTTDLGSVLLGSSTTVGVTVTSNGNNLSLTSFTVGGANSGDFSVDLDTCSPLSFILNQYESCNVNVTFTPQATGSRTGTLRVIANWDDVTINLTGTGTTPTVDFSASTYSGAESGGAITVTANLSASSVNTITVDYASSDSTATAGSDYTAVSGTLSFSPGDTSKTFTVTPTSDTTDENDETVTLTLSNPTNSTLAGTNNPATLTITDDDSAPTVDFSSVAYSGAESGGAITVTVDLSNASAINTITVDYASSDSTATAGSDYTAVGGTLTFSAGETSKTFTVTPTSDTTDENDETVTLTLSNPTNSTLAGTNSPATLTITDDDSAPTVDFSSATYSGTESAGAITVTASLSAASGKTVTVDYASSDSTATAGIDYTAVSGTLTFSAGDTSKTFTVTPTSDTTDENDETVTLTLSNPTNSTLTGTNSPATLTITDDDSAPTVDFSSATYSGAESGGAITVTVDLSNASAINTITVDYASSDSTATAGIDYTAVSGTLTVSAGDTSKTFTVTPTSDTTDENDETVTLTLSNSVNSTLAGTNSPATLTITDDDSAPTVDFSSATYSGTESAGAITVTASLSAASGKTVTVDYASSNGTATAGTDYTAVSSTLTFSAGDTSKTFTVTPTSDTTDENDETVTLTLSNPANSTLAGINSPATLTITDDDSIPTVAFDATSSSGAESTTSATLAVSLANVSAISTITVDYAVTGTATGSGTDYTLTDGTLTFSAGTTTQNISAVIVDDSAEDADETIIVTLSNPVNTTLGTNTTHTYIIADNDSSTILVFFTSDASSQSESTTSANFPVSLSGSSASAITVDYTVTGGTATGSGTDYTLASGTLTFSAGTTTQNISAVIVDDSIYEYDETIIVTLSNPVNASLGTLTTHTYTITKEDVLIPTLSEWGMLLFVLLLTLGGIVFIVKPRYL